MLGGRRPGPPPDRGVPGGGLPFGPRRPYRERGRRPRGLRHRRWGRDVRRRRQHESCCWRASWRWLGRRGGVWVGGWRGLGCRDGVWVGGWGRWGGWRWLWCRGGCWGRWGRWGRWGGWGRWRWLWCRGGIWVAGWRGGRRLSPRTAAHSRRWQASSPWWLGTGGNGEARQQAARDRRGSRAPPRGDLDCPEGIGEGSRRLRPVVGVLGHGPPHQVGQHGRHRRRQRRGGL